MSPSNWKTAISDALPPENVLHSLNTNALHQSLSQFGITEFSPEVCCCTYKFVCIKSYLICPTHKVWLQLATLTCSFIIVLSILFTPERLISLLFQAYSGYIFLCSILLNFLPSFVWEASYFTFNSYPNQNKFSRSTWRLLLLQEAYLIFGIINIPYHWVAPLSTALKRMLLRYGWGWYAHQEQG